MDKVLKVLSDIRVLIAIAVLALLIIVFMIVKKIRSNNYKKELQELEVRYNNLRSVPLSFKMNKAVAISRVDPETMQKIDSTKDEFNKAGENLKQIAQALADTEDEILMGRLKKVRPDLDDIAASISLGETQIAQLDQFLDGILQKETDQRAEVTELKNQFREIKDEATENQTQLSYVWTALQNVFADIESKFSSFEEWMYASDFNKSEQELAGIRADINTARELVHDLPTILEDARGVVPQLLEVVHHEYTAEKERGVYLDHLEVEKNLTLISGNLKQDLRSLKEGDPKDVTANLEDYKTRLNQIDEAIKNESASFDELTAAAKETDRLYRSSLDTLDEIEGQYAKANERFGLTEMRTHIDELRSGLTEVAPEKERAEAMAASLTAPCSESLIAVKKLNERLQEIHDGIKGIKTELDTYSGDEEHAKKQLIKLKAIMNQMQVSIRKYKLPNISREYEDDMNRANEYIRRIQDLIDETPLNVQLLNATLTEAIDYIYKLFNNVNNVVGAVIMVENTIVFGNRYRSTYSDIDSELTRSELCFRNGEYTQALNIAIETIEKIHPGNYEKMVKENAKGAEE
ncbi:MAG: septation ring formation regulator EzrA [Solobacterium sp.]|nr:septation ring formation regulator EzrA [Solobacterium sp.]